MKWLTVWLESRKKNIHPRLSGSSERERERAKKRERERDEKIVSNILLG